jgi:mannitol-1-/sugar-/sorbitol-6-/2-deoxyglucose-6-phosphatase
MNKAFIFDLDGVLINNEPIWEIEKRTIYQNLFGGKIYKELGSTVGLNIPGVYQKAVALGAANVSEKDVYNAFSSKADPIYQNTPITKGINELGKLLLQKQYAIGIVSASPREWMEMVINRLSFKNAISVIISLEERKDLEHKPSPAGYLEAIKTMTASPESTMILEDSNTGIAAAKAAGAFVIGLRQNLVEGYKQEGADMYADTVEDVIGFVQAKQ